MSCLPAGRAADLFLIVAGRQTQGFNKVVPPLVSGEVEDNQNLLP